jgi:hypothetical protein
MNEFADRANFHSNRGEGSIRPTKLLRWIRQPCDQDESMIQ